MITGGGEWRSSQLTMVNGGSYSGLRRSGVSEHGGGRQSSAEEIGKADRKSVGE